MLKMSVFRAAACRFLLPLVTGPDNDQVELRPVYLSLLKSDTDRIGMTKSVQPSSFGNVRPAFVVVSPCETLSKV